MVGNADYLVTGDRDLLCLTNIFACPIVTVEQLFSITRSHQIVLTGVKIKLDKLKEKPYELKT